MLERILVEASLVDKLLHESLPDFSSLVLPLLMFFVECLTLRNTPFDCLQLGLEKFFDLLPFVGWEGVAMQGEDNFFDRRLSLFAFSVKRKDDGERT